MFDITSITTTDIVGYLASITLLISFLMRDIKKLRIINSVGCALFVLYGFMLHYSFPIIITNTTIIIINLVSLYNMRNK
jgi:uncharacterized protein with PQ loop repeat